MSMRNITYRHALREALHEEMTANPDVFLLGEDIGVYGGAFAVTEGLLSEFGPERVMDTPISESAIVGAAIGSALLGLRPVAEIMFFDFITICLDQLANQAAKFRYMSGGAAKIPIVLRTAGGCGTGAAAQHSQSLESWLTHVPGLKVVMPATPYDAKGLLKSAINDDNPVVFIEHKKLYSLKGIVPEESYTIPLGKAEVKKEGTDLTIISYSYGLIKSLQAAESLHKEGINAEVIDIRTLSPLDTETILSSVKKTGRVLFVSEAVNFGGFGAELTAMIAEKALDYLEEIRRLSGAFVPIPYNRNLEAAVVPQQEDIIRVTREMLMSHERISVSDKISTSGGKK